MKKYFTPPLIYKLFIVMMLIVRFLPISKQIGYPLNLGGIILLFVGTIMSMDAKIFFKRANSPIMPDDDPVKLHTKGMFRFSRNPMYLGITIGLMGIAILTGIIYNLSFPILYFFIMDLCFVRLEEKKLDEIFGESYRQYRNETRRWI